MIHFVTFNPSEQYSKEYDASLNTTEPLTNCISTASSGHSCGYFHKIRAEQFSRKKDIRQVKQSYHSSVSCSLRSQLSHSLQLSLNLATVKGASAWLSALPLSENGFTLHKSVFHDAVALRYGWPLSRTPSLVGVISPLSMFYLAPKAVFHPCVIMKSRDLTANLFAEVCHQVHVELELQLVSAPESFTLSTVNFQDLTLP